MMDPSGTRERVRLQLERSTVPGSSYTGRDGRLGLRNVLARRRRCDRRGAGLRVRCVGHHGDIVYVGIALRRDDQPTLAQKSRYPRSRKPLPVRKLPAKGNLAVLGEAEEVKRYVAHELCAALPPEVRLDVVQVPRAKALHCLGRLLGSLVVVVGEGANVLCVLGEQKYPKYAASLSRARSPANQKTRTAPVQE
jgi:hypothetical protein